MPKYITLEQLVKKYARPDQTELFKKLFPYGKALVTVKKAEKLAQEFDWNWAAKNLLDLDAWKAYRAVERPAWEAYNTVERPAWEAYEAAKQTVWEAYLAAKRPAWEAYLAAKQPARAAYKIAQAKAFANAYLSME